jgi:flagellar protein FlaJ
MTFKYIYELVSVVLGVSIVIANNLYSIEHEFLIPILNMVGGMIALVPPLLVFYSKYKQNKEIETQFIIYVTDLSEAMESGMTLPVALKYCSKREYGILTKHIHDMAIQVDWGVPFSKSLQIFAKNISSVPISRAVRTIIETYKVGGKINDALKAITISLVEINKIKSERSVSVHSQIMTSYMIFFIFIFILVTLQSFLIPALATPEVPDMMEGGGTPMSIELYSASFLNFILIQGMFAGLATGKMSEGSIIAGMKHSVILTVSGYTLFSLAAQFKISL